MSDAAESSLSAPVTKADREPRSIWQAGFAWILRLVLVAGGALIGAFLGLVVALFTGLIDIGC